MVGVVTEIATCYFGTATLQLQKHSAMNCKQGFLWTETKYNSNLRVVNREQGIHTWYCSSAAAPTRNKSTKMIEKKF